MKIAKKDDRKLIIPPIPMTSLDGELLGVTPLLCDKYFSDVFEEWEARNKGGLIEQKIKEYSEKKEEAIALTKLYSIDGKSIGFPVGGLKGGMITALMNKNKNKANKMKGLDGKVLKSYISISGIVGEDGDLMLLSFDNLKIFHHVAKNKDKNMIKVVRPGLENWKATFTITFNHAAISVDEIASLIQEAGMFSGLGAWRPANNGTFGKFSLVSLIPSVQAVAS